MSMGKHTNAQAVETSSSEDIPSPRAQLQVDSNTHATGVVPQLVMPPRLPGAGRSQLLAQRPGSRLDDEWMGQFFPPQCQVKHKANRGDKVVASWM